MFGKKSESSEHVTNHTITTLIGPAVVFDGNITGNGCIKIDGTLNGNVMSTEGLIVIGEAGHVKGNIQGIELVVYGHIHGDVTADTLTLKSCGVVTGNIQVRTLEIESGASYQGTVQMQTSSTSVVTHT